MRFIHLSDLHIGKKVNEFSMIEDQKYILNQVLSIIDTQKVEGVWIAGDVYDKAIPPQEAIVLFDWFLKELADRHLYVYIISGNHDSMYRLAFGSSLMESSHIYFSKVFDGQIDHFTIDDAFGPINIYLLPFLKPAYVRPFFDDEMNSYQDAIELVLKNNPIDTSQRNIILAHQFVNGASTCESEELAIGGLDQISSALFDDYDYVALGHIHGPQSISKPTIRYSGTLLKYSFSEVHHKKQVLIVDILEKGNIKIEPIYVKPLRDLVEIKGTYLEISDHSFYKDLSLDDYYHITLTDEDDLFLALDKLREIYPNIMKLDYDNTRTRHIAQIVQDDAFDQKKPFNFIQDFYEMMNGSSMDEDTLSYTKALVEKIWEDEV